VTRKKVLQFCSSLFCSSVTCQEIGLGKKRKSREYRLPITDYRLPNTDYHLSLIKQIHKFRGYRIKAPDVDVLEVNLCGFALQLNLSMGERTGDTVIVVC